MSLERDIARCSTETHDEEAAEEAREGVSRDNTLLLCGAVVDKTDVERARTFRRGGEAEQSSLAGIASDSSSWALSSDCTRSSLITVCWLARTVNI